MQLLVALSILVSLCLPVPSQQTARAARRKLDNKPACSPNAVCFSGEVSEGQEFRRSLGQDLEFVLQPGWRITIAPKPPKSECHDLAWVVNPPYRSHTSLNIDTTYGTTAEDEVANSPREFVFVTNCDDYRMEAKRVDIVLWPYTATQAQVHEASAKLGSSPTGKGRLWITDSKVTHASDTPDNQLGAIQWMKFTVEILLPPNAR